jgi:hypothetical protein
MTIKTYHYYIVGALSFVAWLLLVVFALEVAIRLGA